MFIKLIQNKSDWVGESPWGGFFLCVMKVMIDN